MRQSSSVEALCRNPIELPISNLELARLTVTKLTLIATITMPPRLAPSHDSSLNSFRQVSIREPLYVIGFTLFALVCYKTQCGDASTATNIEI